MKDANSVFESFLPYANLERGQSVGVFRLDRMEALCALTGRPQDSFRSVHVAGSKGKGSVSAMIASAIAAGGARVGLYTSPHVVEYRERIRVLGEDIPDSVFVSEGERIARLLCGWERTPHARLGPPTFFELVTLLGFLVFRSSGCQWAVIETGLGGRLDSTNVIVPEASVLTAIELEHTEYLGGSIEEIAGEKAGIIKPGRPAFAGNMRPEALSVMRARAGETGADFLYAPDRTALESVEVGEDSTKARIRLRGRDGRNRILDLRLRLPGRVQAENAALAAVVLDSLFPDMPDGLLAEGLGLARLPARFQLLRVDPPFVADGAHTPVSASLCLETWLSLYGEDGLLVFGCAADKDVKSMAGILGGHFGKIIVTSPGSFKKSSPLAAFEAFRGSCGGALVLEPDTLHALRLAWDSGRKALAVGSFYLAAEAVKAFTGR